MSGRTVAPSPSRLVLVLAPCASLRPRLARPRPSPAPSDDWHQSDADATCTPYNTTRHSRDSENSFVEQLLAILRKSVKVMTDSLKTGARLTEASLRQERTGAGQDFIENYMIFGI